MTEQTAGQKELVLERLIKAPPEKVFRCWSEPELMKQWISRWLGQGDRPT